MTITKDKVVQIDYTLTNDQGEVIDTSEGKQPLAYLHGRGQIIAGLEQALDGKANGEELTVAIPPKDAYGERSDDMVQPVPRENFPDNADITPGMQFQAQTSGGPRIVTVVEAGDAQVTVDANHPLAGQTLHFQVAVREVRDATSEELSHGHAHGEGGHQH